MKEIALYTLDIAQNSITAQAKRLDITEIGLATKRAQ